ncbi:DUF1904 family protein [Spiroplasma endosymbiont of Cantharis rufa]|uniref:DUF1904 family protein n=1 Tax=Spiroplasma endosymbiont of Cantharis rufa TaxID=3066279 RepID=UPI0030CC2BA8
MPIFSFKGVNETHLQEYFKKIDELALIINTDSKKIVFWNDTSTLIGDGYEKNVIQINIDWIARPLKQAEVVNHIQKFFSKISKNIYVIFKEINNLLYINGENKN